MRDSSVSAGCETSAATQPATRPAARFTHAARAAGERRAPAQWDPTLTLTLAPPPVPRFDRRCAQAGGAWPAAAGVGGDWELLALKTGAPKEEGSAEAVEAALRETSAAQARGRGLECLCTPACHSVCR